jgi:hypothetical protein
MRSKDVCGGEQRTPDWYAGREKLIIAGSAFAKSLPKSHPWHDGMERDETKRSVFGYKRPERPYVRRMMDVGVVGEEVAVNTFLEAFLEEGQQVEKPGLLIHNDEPSWGGSPDLVVKDKDGNPVYIGEAKTLVGRELEFDENGEAIVPLKYYAQAHWYMYLVNVRLCAFIQYEARTGRVAVTWLEYDDELMAQALASAEEYTARIKQMRASVAELVVATAGLMKCGGTEPRAVMDKVLDLAKYVEAIIDQDAAPPVSRKRKGSSITEAERKKIKAEVES